MDYMGMHIHGDECYQKGRAKYCDKPEVDNRLLLRAFNALVDVIYEEWPRTTPLQDIVRYNGATAKDYQALEKLLDG